MTGERKRRVLEMLQAFPGRYRRLRTVWQPLCGLDGEAGRRRLARREALGNFSREDWREFSAVWQAVCQLWEMEQGEVRLRSVGLLYWGGCTLEGAALNCYCHRSTVCRWNQEFLALVEAECAETPGAKTL